MTYQFSPFDLCPPATIIAVKMAPFLVKWPTGNDIQEMTFWLPSDSPITVQTCHNNILGRFPEGSLNTTFIEPTRNIPWRLSES